MKAATVNEIKTALESLSHPQLEALCLRFVKFRKENKELATFMLFESDNLNGYIQEAVSEMEAGFAAINKSNLYIAKKSLRKLLREANKHIRYTGSKTAEVELLTAWCRLLRKSGIAFDRSTTLLNLYHSQFKKIRKTIEGLHEDLQRDYTRALDQLAK
ncbi:MAG: hypothetical protein QM664_03445 [Flavihumibacter sp.]